MWKKIEMEQIARGSVPKECKFDMTQVEGFRYCMEDGLRSVTKSVIREAQIKEIKNKILNSTKLKASLLFEITYICVSLLTKSE